MDIDYFVSELRFHPMIHILICSSHWWTPYVPGIFSRGHTDSELGKRMFFLLSALQKLLSTFQKLLQYFSPVYRKYNDVLFFKVCHFLGMPHLTRYHSTNTQATDLFQARNDTADSALCTPSCKVHASSSVHLTVRPKTI